jgi:hypothetical protein
MSYNLTQLELTLFDHIAALLTPLLPSTKVAWEHQDALRPRAPMMTLYVIRDEAIGHASERYTDEPAGTGLYTEEVAQDRVCELRLTAYGGARDGVAPSASAIMARVLERHELSAFNVQLDEPAAGRVRMALISASPATRIPAMLSQGTEDRMVATLRYHYTPHHTAPTMAVESAHVEVENGQSE